MQRNQATGIDTKMLLPVYTGIFCVISYFFLPLFSAPELRSKGMLDTGTLKTLSMFVDNLCKTFLDGGKLFGKELPLLIALGASMVTAGMLLLAGAILRKKKRCSIVTGIVYGINVLFALALIAVSVVLNLLVQGTSWRAHPFLNLTLLAKIRPTSFVYANLFLSVLMILRRKRFFLEQETKENACTKRQWKEDRTIGKRTKVSLFLLLIGIPLVLFFGIFFLNNRSNLFIGLCIICFASLPFFMMFEDRRPQARELILIAVLSAIAVVGRIAFFMIPQFKPMAAVVIIAGIGLGAEAGFLTGVVSGFVSNFFFGQGPWTPWQMFALGMIGCLAGLLFYGKKRRSSKVFQCCYGAVATFFIYGGLMDTASVLMVLEGWSKKAFLTSYLTGIPFNTVHALSTMFFLAVLGGPMERKLNRVKKKYGMLQC